MSGQQHRAAEISDPQPDHRLKELDTIIASRAQAKARRREADLPLTRLAATIRSQVTRYRQRDPKWRSKFDYQISSFRCDYYRDNDWYGETEQRYEQWLQNFENRQPDFDWFAAMPVVFLADVYHRQKKYAQALATYRKAIQAARKAIVVEDFRCFLIRWLRITVKACVHQIGPIPVPPYDGPRRHQRRCHNLEPK
jgi:tetratricopeptide (TPR) repeat protein